MGGFARRVASGTACALVACLLAAAAVANGASGTVAFPLAAALALAGAAILAPRVPRTIACAVTGRRGALFCVLALAAVLATARLSFTMSRPPAPVSWTGSEFLRNHSCATSYYRGGLDVTRVDNVYDLTHYVGPDGRSTEIEGFKTDPYQYPPMFLLLAAPIARAVPHYLGFRGVWFALMGGLALVAFLRLGGWLGGAWVWWSLLAWLAIPTQVTLQAGNFQIGAVALAVLGMIFVGEGRKLAGGALVGFAAAAKIFPGVLIVYLLARREYRAVAAAAVTGVVAALLAAAFFGIGPLELFATWHLPRLDSGEALPALRLPGALAINVSVPGLLLKAQLFGASISRELLSAAGWIYSAAVLILAALVGRRPAAERVGEAATWLALVGLAAMRSPFLPNSYGTLPAIWIATILLAAGRTRAAVVALVALNLYLPNDAPVPLAVRAAAAGVNHAAALLLYGWALVGIGRSIEVPRGGDNQ